jgi:hypothetical protein
VWIIAQPDKSAIVFTSVIRIAHAVAIICYQFATHPETLAGSSFYATATFPVIQDCFIGRIPKQFSLCLFTTGIRIPGSFPTLRFFKNILPRRVSGSFASSSGPRVNATPGGCSPAIIRRQLAHFPFNVSCAAA